jgi:hypothetical protein
VQPGSLLVLQVHYNLLATDGEPAGTDQSSVRLRLTDGTAETVAVDTLPLLAPIELPCLPDESGPLCDRQGGGGRRARALRSRVRGPAHPLEQTCGIPARATPRPATTSCPCR